MQRDPLAYRRYAVLDATQANTDQVSQDTKSRERELQEQIATTLDDIKAAPTEAETQKLSAKLSALNGQLAQVEAARRREVDAVALQKIANDARAEEERQAAAELAAKDDYLANQRVSSYLKTLRVRKNPPGEN
jgi:protein involved in temperature-dependent protein secretion